MKSPCELYEAGVNIDHCARPDRRRKSRDRLPVVLTSAEVRALLHELNGSNWLVAALLYGTGMRLLEGLRLRVKRSVLKAQSRRS